MARRKRYTFPTFTIGQSVTVTRNIIRTPLIPEKGRYGDPYVLVPAGTAGRVTERILTNGYRVQFDGLALVVHASSLAPA